MQPQKNPTKDAEQFPKSIFPDLKKDPLFAFSTAGCNQNKHLLTPSTFSDIISGAECKTRVKDDYLSKLFMAS